MSLRAQRNDRHPEEALARVSKDESARWWPSTSSRPLREHLRMTVIAVRDHCAAAGAVLAASSAAAIASSTRSSQMNSSLLRAPRGMSSKSRLLRAGSMTPGQAGRGGGDDFLLDAADRQHEAAQAMISPVIAVSLPHGAVGQQRGERA